MEKFLAVLILAAANEAIIEFLVKPVLEKFVKESDSRDIIYRSISAVGGVVLTILFATDLLALFGIEAILPYVGQVVTGLLIGRGANWIHDFISRWVEPIRGEVLSAELVVTEE